MAQKAGTNDGIGTMATLTATIVLGGAVFVLSQGSVGRCAGARRSVRLKLEAQQAQVQQQLSAPETSSAAPVEPKAADPGNPAE